MLVGGFFADLLGYWAAVGILHAVEYYRESQARALQAAELDSALRSAALENLKAQLQPHFLFNTLQAISTLIHRDPSAADRMLTDLSDLLRVSLRHAAAQEVPLREELGFLNRYIDIMRERFGYRLAIEVDVAPELLDAMVPSLVLQPLVENAIRHGMGERDDRGSVAISSRREGKSLLLEVSDDGRGLAGGVGSDGNGIGLANTRERLIRMYGPGNGIEVVSRNDAARESHGVTVRLTIPFRSSDSLT
jgi:LytS/YehU family sensor histidine kinase